MQENRKNIWLIGTGLMGQEYAKVLRSLGSDVKVIGRGEENCSLFREKTGIQALTGGLAAHLQTDPEVPEYAIVAVGIEALTETVLMLIRHGVKYILLEKPGVGYPYEIDEISEAAEASDAHILIAYNRRFYASVMRARELIREDGGVRSMHFEFTEWSHVIRDLKKHKAEHENWFLGNSTHVIDTAFHLGGKPTEMCSFVKGGIEWHPSSSVFSGAGITEVGALFSYHANWEGPGRWTIDIITSRHRFIFKPMESLQVQKIGSVAVEPVVIDDSLDKEFKPGLYLQTKVFLDHDFSMMVTLAEQKRMIGEYYMKMSGYSWS